MKLFSDILYRRFFYCFVLRNGIEKEKVSKDECHNKSRDNLPDEIVTDTDFPFRQIGFCQIIAEKERLQSADNQVCHVQPVVDRRGEAHEHL